MRFTVSLLFGVPMLALGAWKSSSTTVSPAPQVCDEGPVPVVWPIGPDGFVARRLYDSHGQFLDLTGSDPFIHRGVDVAACVDDVVYAVEAGVVEYVYEDVGGDASQLYVSDSVDGSLGWYYMHLDKIYVVEGDTVHRDQALGTVVEFDDYTGFDHVHLQRVTPWSEADGWSGEITDAGNPLSWLVSRADGKAPAVLPHPAPMPPGVHFRFFEDGGSSAVLPVSLSGKKVDVVVNVRELFPGAGAPACSTSTCAPVAMVHEIMPMRLSFGIFEIEDDPAGSGFPRKVVDEVFHNVIDLTQPFTSETELAGYVYRDGSIGNYTERLFLVDLTHCQTDGVGSFEFKKAGDYLLQVVLEDASGNVGVRSITVDIL
jgi:hypothetical protein